MKQVYLVEDLLWSPCTETAPDFAQKAPPGLALKASLFS
jgi:hypothetical protein